MNTAFKATFVTRETRYVTVETTTRSTLRMMLRYTFVSAIGT